jgi:cell division protein FtsZ
MDLSIGEFDEVGNTVKQFASENATVVVGTVIDPEMSGEMRVTIVATGLGQAAREEASKVKLVRAAGGGGVDYREFDVPTALRNQRPENDNNRSKQENDPDYLDIPAFLRRQAD